jgi:hypothetical protein
MALEEMERRLLLTLPDLKGYDGRPTYPSAYFYLADNTVYWGDQIKVSFDIANAGGSVSGSPTQNVAFYLSNDASVTPSTDYLLAKFTLGVPAGGKFNGYTASMTLPAVNPNGGSGTYYVGMFVDADKQITESDESNNKNQGVGIDLAKVTIYSPKVAVSDSSRTSTDRSVSFGSVVDDGPGNSLATQTVTISDSSPSSILTVAQNGIALANGTNFHIASIISNQRSAPVNLSGGSAPIAANSAEKWLVTLTFDPTAVGALTDTLVIKSDDLSAPTVNVALSGTGTAVANLAVADFVGSGTDRAVDFGNVAVDGAGGASGAATVTLTNTGSGPLTVNQNGITLPAGPFSVKSVVSSTRGAINLATASNTIAAAPVAL